MCKYQCIEFSGGNNLEGLLLIYHHVMMQNELGKGHFGYELSHAELGVSGYSFGGHQMDLLHDKKARIILKDILMHEKIEEISFERIMSIVLSQNTRLVENDIALVSAALSSPYGIQKINQAYQELMIEKSNYINSLISETPTPIQKLITDSHYLMALIFDYNNQYGMSRNGKFHQLLIRSTACKVEELTETILQYMRSTLYYSKSPSDIERRLKNIANIINDHNNEDFLSHADTNTSQFRPF